MALLDLIKGLGGTYGVSGDEDRVANMIKRELKPYADELIQDSSGNVIAHKNGSGLRILLSAHMDEIGLMVKSINEDHMIRISPVGGIEPETLLAQQVHIDTRKGIVHGVISCKELHRGEEISDFPKVSEMYVDIGAKSKEDIIKAGVAVGDYIVPRRSFATLGNKRVISGKALDNRVGCAVVLETAKKLRNSKADVYYMFTVEEEMGLYGARTSVSRVSPDVVINMDTTVALDTEKNVKGIGDGPVIILKDSEFISERKLNEIIKCTAKRIHVPLQFEVSDVGTTDALAIYLNHGGVPTTAVSVPVRNIHSTISIAHMDDVENAVKLLNAAVRDLSKKKVIK
ncbi:MAG: M28 family peptidase [Candidatus Diapherotrites archaeon]|nr:M28 family peptidase [Candidatus Diapherotrites archaeon]